MSVFVALCCRPLRDDERLPVRTHRTVSEFKSKDNQSADGVVNESHVKRHRKDSHKKKDKKKDKKVTIYK